MPVLTKVLKQQVLGKKISPVEEDFLAVEEPLEIGLEYDRGGSRISKSLTVTMRTPGNDTELIHGFLFAEGIIRKAEEITSIELQSADASASPFRAIVTLAVPPPPSLRKRNFTAYSSCGVCGVATLAGISLAASLKIRDSVRIDPALVHDLPDRMRAKQETFHNTGGLHAAALFSSTGAVLAVREDIGRHNALDKSVGAGLLAGFIPGTGHILCVSGRTSYEILQKALVARIPVIVGIGAPSSLAVLLANDFQVTLLGFVRQGRYNVYSCPTRLDPA